VSNSTQHNAPPLDSPHAGRAATRHREIQNSFNSAGESTGSLHQEAQHASLVISSRASLSVAWLLRSEIPLSISCRRVVIQLQRTTLQRRQR